MRHTPVGIHRGTGPSKPGGRFIGHASVAALLRHAFGAREALRSIVCGGLLALPQSDMALALESGSLQPFSFGSLSIGMLLLGAGALIHRRQRQLRAARNRIRTLEVKIAHLQRAQDGRQGHDPCREPALSQQALFEAAPLGLALVDDQLRYRTFNRQMAQITGCPMEEAAGRPVDDLAPELGKPLACLLERVQRTGQAITESVLSVPAAVAPNATRHWSVSAIPLHDPTGAPLGVGLILQDITARRQAELRLQHSARRYQLLTEVVPLLVWMSDPVGKQIYTNRHWLKYTGLPGAAIRGLGWLRLVHPQDRRNALLQFREAHRRAGHYEAEFRLRRAGDGAYRWHLARALALRDEEGQARQWLGVAMDIHDRKCAEDKLRHTERLFLALDEAIDYGVWVCTGELKNVYASESFLKLVGMSAEELHGEGWERLLSPEQLAETKAEWARNAHAGTIWDKELRARGADGRWHDILTRGAPVRGDNGEIEFWVGISLDISRIKAAEQTLIEEGRRKNAFIAMLAHELRNPMTPILTAAQLLRRAGASDATLAEWAGETIETQVTHLTRLVNDLLDVSRHAQGRLKLESAPVDLRTVVTQAVETAQPNIQQRQQTLVTAGTDEPLWVVGDRARLVQVLGNLLLNASKFTPAHGRIECRLEHAAEAALITVRDNGIGMHPDLLSSIFEPFVQLRAADDPARGGLGIGLALVRSLVELHGGKVHAHSEGEGCGSTFTVRLPYLIEPPLPKDTGGGLVTPVNHERNRILLVDDNPDILEALALLLRGHGYQVEAAADGELAVTIAKRFLPHTALIDLGLPSIDGYEVARRLRALPELTGLRLAAMTGYGRPRDEHYARAQGFDHYLIKPVDAGQLLGILSATVAG